MTQFQDELGISYTAGNPESVSTFNRVIESYLGSQKDTPAILEELMTQDPEMPMAQCFRAYMLKLAADPRFSIPVTQLVGQLNNIAPSMNKREQMHVQAVNAWAANDLAETVNVLEQILAEHPKDMLALRVAHYLHFYAGASSDMRDSVANAVSNWREEGPFYGYLLGMHSFGLEEAGDYAEAEAAGKRAVEINNNDVWAAHAVTHVFQMQSRFDDGIPWVGGLLPGWEDTNNFVYHMHWHKALCHIGAGELDAALDIYDARLIEPVADDFYLDVCNAASLLWRLEMLGMNVGSRWDTLKEYAARRIHDNELLFSTLHYLMVAARLKDKQTIEQGLTHFRDWSNEQTTQGALCREVGLPLAEAIVDLGLGRRAEAAQILTDVKDQIVKIGGSHAQRELFNLFRESALA
jgi:tetratricopeptide (TPR) repeat protein